MAESPKKAAKGAVATLVAAPIAAGALAGFAMHSGLVAAVAAIAAFPAAIAMMLKLTPTRADLTPGTRAWEARMTNAALVVTIGARTKALATADALAKPRLEREIEFLTQHLRANDAIIASGDRSPGRGVIGFKAYQGD